MRKLVVLLSVFLTFCSVSAEKKFKNALSRGDYYRAYSILSEVKNNQRKAALTAEFISSIEAKLPDVSIGELLKMRKVFTDNQKLISLIKSELKNRFDAFIKKGEFIKAGGVVRVSGEEGGSLRRALLSALFSKYFSNERVPEISSAPSPLISAFPEQNCIIKYTTSKGVAEAWYSVDGVVVRLTGRKAKEDEITNLSLAMFFAQSLDQEMMWYGADKELVSQLAGVNYFTFKQSGGRGMFVWEADKNAAWATYIKNGKIIALFIPQSGSAQAKKAFFKIFRGIRFEKI